MLGLRMKKGLVLDNVVLLGRTLEEYRRYFALDLNSWRGRRVLDVASGVSSFCAEANAAGWDVTALDPIYELSPEMVEPRCEKDLDLVIDRLPGTTVYNWEFYQSPERLRGFRERAYRTFLADYRTATPERYVSGSLPRLPFVSGAFDLSLVSYLLLVYQKQLDYSFHKQSILELMRVTRGEARLYPVVTFEAERSEYLARFDADPELTQFSFDEVPTDFEFLLGSNRYLRIRHR